MGNPRGTKPGEKDKNLANGGTHPLNYNGHVVVALQCFPWSVRGKREEAYHKLPCVTEGLVTSVQSIFHAFVRFCRALFQVMSRNAFWIAVYRSLPLATSSYSPTFFPFFFFSPPLCLPPSLSLRLYPQPITKEGEICGVSWPTSRGL